MQIERRFIDAGKIELRRAAADTKTVTIRGYAAKFNTLSENLGGFREQIAPGAFGDCLSQDVRCLFNHNPDAILGRTASGTLRIFQDSVGLGYEVDLPDTQAARDLQVAVDRGDVSQSSFGFRVAPNGDAWAEADDGAVIRTINRMGRLFDVSPVTFPAYTDTTTGLRSLDAWKASRHSALEAEQARARAEAARALASKRRELRMRA